MDGNHDLSKSPRPHLTKEQRLPNCYKEVEKIVKSVKSCQTNFKTALANSRLRGSQFKKVYKLSLNVLKYYNYIQKIIDKLQILEKEKFLRKEIAAVLIFELIFGNGSLPGESKAVNTVQAYQDDIMNIHQELQSHGTDFVQLNEIYVPRYVRVHTLVTTVAYVIQDLENYGFKQIFYDVDLSEEKFFQLVKSLKKGSFLVDFHFKDILVFAQAENLIHLDLYKNGHIFLQDKASYIPVHALNPEPGSTVLDACAAPGMKSAHIASKMKNKGMLIACERDESRFETLKETLKYGSVKISKTLCTDFKLIDPNDEGYSTVEYILLDPSCSGSGMVYRMDEVTDTEESKTKERLIKLAGFQIVLLKHALKFPSVKRVVYSTCSVHEEENEYVVHEALDAFGGIFKLVPVISEWFDRGLENYEYGKMCLRTVPEKHLTNGFFVAMFERINIHEHRKDNLFVKNSKRDVNVKISEGISFQRIDLSFQNSNLKRKSLLPQEDKCKKNKIDETEEYQMGNEYTYNKCISTAHKEKKYNSFSQQQKGKKDYSQSYKQYKQINNSDLEMSYNTLEGTESCVQNIGDMTHGSYNEKSDSLKTQDCSKHKRKKKKHATNIQLKLDKEDQEELLSISSPDLQQKCENSEVLKKIPKLNYAVNDYSDVFISQKEAKHKRHLSSDNTVANFGNNHEKSSDVKLKHKKRNKKHPTDDSSFTEGQCDKYHSDVLHQSAEDYQNFNQNANHNSFLQVSNELKMLDYKKKDKRDTTNIVSNEQDRIEEPKATLLETIQKSKNSLKFINTPMKQNEIKDRMSKHKERLLENDPENIGNCEIFVGSNFKHKKRKRGHSTDENINTYVHEIETMNKINSFENKEMKERYEYTNSCIQSDCLENKYQKGDKDSSNILPKSKKNKKHKKHSKKSDSTASQLDNLTECNFSESQINSKNYSSTKSAENLSHNLQNEEMIKKLYLADNSKCKKNRKYELHTSKYHGSNEINFSSDKHTNCTSGDAMSKDDNKTVISVENPNQHHYHIKRKRKKYKIDKTNDSPNFPSVNTNAQPIDTVCDMHNILLSRDAKSLVIPAQKDSVKRKKREKPEKHSSSDMCFFTDANLEKKVEENVPFIIANRKDSLHSELGSKNCCKISEYDTGVPLELDNLSYQPKEPENILYCDKVKKKKKVKKHYSS